MSVDANELYNVKAGRAIRRGTTNFVDPQDVKGSITVFTDGNGLLHFGWQNRTTQDVELDLITFPGEATLTKVNEAQEGRVYVLKFSSSDHRHFFWLQDLDTSLDEQNISNLNGLLEDPDFTPEITIPDSAILSERGTTATDAAAPQSASTSSALPGSSNPPTQAQLDQLRTLVQGLSAAPLPPSYSLTDILTPTVLQPIFASPDLVRTLLPHLPADLPTDPSPEAIRQIVESPQFQTAVRQLQRALETGLLGELVVEMGLPREAGTSVEAFLRAIGEQANRGHGSGTSRDSMDTD